VAAGAEGVEIVGHGWVAPNYLLGQNCAEMVADIANDKLAGSQRHKVDAEGSRTNFGVPIEQPSDTVGTCKGAL